MQTRKLLTLLIAIIGFLPHIRGQVTIGTLNPPHASAVLELDSENKDKGFLLPRVNLKSASDVSTIPNPKKGLLVYNLGQEASFPVVALVYWNGTEWTSTDSYPLIVPEIDDIYCKAATLVPATYTAGTFYKGILTVPYVGGNGGLYQGTAWSSTTYNGLKIRRQEGRLTYGDGKIQFLIEGTPTVTSPETTTIPINFLGKSCSVEVGSKTEIKTVKYILNKAPIDASCPTASITTLGNLQIRYNSIDPGNLDYIEFRTLTPTHVSYSFRRAGYTSNNEENYGQAASQGISNNAIWFKLYRYNDLIVAGNMSNSTVAKMTPANRQIAYCLFALHNTKEVYRITVTVSNDIAAASGVNKADNQVIIFIEQLH